MFMKKLLIPVLCLSGFLAITCDKMDSTYRDFLQDGPIIYSQRVDSVHVYSGRNRVLVTWDPIKDPRVSKVKI